MAAWPMVPEPHPPRDARLDRLSIVATRKRIHAAESIEPLDAAAAILAALLRG
jgi:hypothetical protein